MKLAKPSFKIETVIDGEAMLKRIEAYGRTCYRSELSTFDNTVSFIKMIVRRGHESVLEHESITVRIICDRGVQESTRYCTYGKDDRSGEVTFIVPRWIADPTGPIDIWIEAMKDAEKAYLRLLQNGWTAEQARSVLPNSLRTEIVITANLREWRHIFKLRTSIAAHPQMREIMIPLQEEFRRLIPIIFDEEKPSGDSTKSTR